MGVVKDKRRIRHDFDKKEGKIIREGESNENKILELIRRRENESQRENQGISPSQLLKKTNLSRQAIHGHLKKLLSEQRIYKKRMGNEMQYFPQNSSINDAHLFGFTMADRLMFMIDKGLVPPLEQSDFLKNIPPDQPLYQYPPDIDFSRQNLRPTSHDYFLKAMSGDSVSEDYSVTKFTNDNTIEKNLFEFVNRVGAYIAYIFIEALRPLAMEMNATENKKEERIRYLINIAIPIERLFQRFCQLLGQLNIMRSVKNLYNSEESVSQTSQLKEASFEKLSDSFRSVYPRLYDALENFWFNSRMTYLKRHTLFAENYRCIHKWENYHLYKTDLRCYICSKCHLMAERKVEGRGKNVQK